ncbi:uncharacterized protein LOC127248089 isoform X2 [Andrographis paniculata]|uniref:uncharacterized protein LOC127248089 isoform X2 n=1 Tax=Andrographis paniculata TaxID=175694 RepID=UPI0021E74EDC|nr:uncharacterized protein LOC127248089 isoform X2 [Andrographis paniculata]
MSECIDADKVEDVGFSQKNLPELLCLDRGGFPDARPVGHLFFILAAALKKRPPSWPRDNHGKGRTTLDLSDAHLTQLSYRTPPPLAAFLSTLPPTPMASYPPSQPTTSGKRVRETRIGHSGIEITEERAAISQRSIGSESYRDHMEALGSANAKKLPIPCEFHVKGWCIRGESCRFLHSDKRQYTINAIASSRDSIQPQQSCGKFNFRTSEVSSSPPGTLKLLGSCDYKPSARSIPPHDIRSGSQIKELDPKVDGRRAQKNFEVALIMHVKELLEPAWSRGHLRKDDFKLIVQKSVEKVLASFQPYNVPIPSSSEEIRKFICSFRAKLEKLIQAYIKIYRKR